MLVEWNNIPNSVGYVYFYCYFCSVLVKNLIYFDLKFLR